MTLTADQIKGRIKQLARQNSADARVLIRIYMMERFLERAAVSGYSDNLIIKGGILVTSMVGIAMRSTMDIDTSVHNINLSDEDALIMIKEISSIDLGDGVIFRIKETSRIMDEMDYPGVRITMDAIMEKMITPIKIDISTGDVITPREIKYSYKLMLEDRCIDLWSYNLETILAEKLQTVLARGITNTRMRDMYDIHILLAGYEDKVDTILLKKAFKDTCTKRGSSNLDEQGEEILITIANDTALASMWLSYQSKFSYANGITYDDVVRSVSILYRMCSLSDGDE